MTTEQQLQAIIEAQVKGGFDRWDWLRDLLSIGFPEEEYSALEIVLDPAGLHAIFKADDPFDQPWSNKAAREAFQEIALAWYDSGGDATKTIDTAFSLLPR